MNITASQYAQMVIAAVGGIAFFLMLFRLPEKRSLAFLLLLIPFEVIDSRFASINTILIYVAAFTFLLQGRLTRLPFFGPILLIVFAFVLAFTQSPPEARIYHLIYLVGFFSNILIFFLVYNYILRTGDWRFIFRCLIWLNAAVIVYCAVQFVAGDSRIAILGIDEFSLKRIRSDGRLVGPFRATAATAEYLAFQCLIFAYLLLHKPGRLLRHVALGMITANFLFLIATGNRGGFVSILLSLFLFLLFYRRELGLARAVKMTLAGATLFTAVAIVAINYTNYGMLFDRLEGTEIEGGIPDTRLEVWPVVWERIAEKPIIGHGPEIAINPRTTSVEKLQYIPYPHNLLLHILYTTGIVGVVAWVAFFTTLFVQLYRVRRPPISDLELAGLPRLGIVVLLILFVSQLRIEFLRGNLFDFQNYLFVLFAIFLATSDLARRQLREQKTLRGFGKLNEGSAVEDDPSNAMVDHQPIKSHLPGHT